MPPPGAGFVTVTVALPAVATSLAVGIAAESLVALTKVVGSGLPLKFTADFASKFAPLTVRVKERCCASFSSIPRELDYSNC